MSNTLPGFIASANTSGNKLTMSIPPTRKRSRFRPWMKTIVKWVAVISISGGIGYRLGYEENPCSALQIILDYPVQNDQVSV